MYTETQNTVYVTIAAEYERVGRFTGRTVTHWNCVVVQQSTATVKVTTVRSWEIDAIRAACARQASRIIKNTDGTFIAEHMPVEAARTVGIWA